MTTPRNTAYTPLAYLAMLAGPLLLLPIEMFVPYSYVLEEVYKSTALSWSGVTTQKSKLSHLIPLTAGIVFALSESMLYLYNFLMLNAYQALMTRFIWTTLMHVVTTYVLFLVGHQTHLRKIGGLATAILIHILYNEILVGFLK